MHLPINIFKRLSLVLLCCLAGCKKNTLTIAPDRVVRAAADFVQNDENLSIFSEVIQAAGMTDSLNSAAPITLFAPSNDAFALNGIQSFGDLHLTPAQLKDFVNYLILPRRLFYSDIPQSANVSYPDVLGDLLYITRPLPSRYGAAGPLVPDSGALHVNGVSASYKDITVTNGVIHIMSDLLKHDSGTVKDRILADTALSFFAAGLKQFNLLDSLAVAGPVTVFAPTNSAFLAMNIGLDSIQRITPARYSSVVYTAYILSPYRVFLSDFDDIGGVIVNGNLTYQSLYNLQQSFMLYPAGKVQLFFNTQNLSVIGHNIGSGQGDPTPVTFSLTPSNVLVSNGVVHHLDSLLVYPDSVKMK